MNTPPELRAFQAKHLADIRQQWMHGNRNVGGICCVGAGKTVMSSHLIKDNPGRSLAVAHRKELVGQMSVAIARSGIKHKIITKSMSYLRMIAKLHVLNFGESFIDQSSKVAVGGVKSVINVDDPDELRKLQETSLLIVDEAHHVLNYNEWGMVCGMTPNAYGYFPTATPCRTDRKRLGRYAEGVLDVLVEGPSMADMIEMGFICNYEVHGADDYIDVAQLSISDTTGDFVKEHIDRLLARNSLSAPVYQQWDKWAKNKLTIVFTNGEAESIQTLNEFRKHSVPSVILSAKTPELERFEIMRKFRAREILVLINIDILGEGVDVPDVECVIMARPTASIILQTQQIGRALRLLLTEEEFKAHARATTNRERRDIIARSRKPHGIVIDLVGNIIRLLPPDTPRIWSLGEDNGRVRSKSATSMLKFCTNKECLKAHSRFLKICPYCHQKPEIIERGSIKVLEGDVLEFGGELLDALRGKIARDDGTPLYPQHAPDMVKRAIIRRWEERKQAQQILRASIAMWRGCHVSKFISESDSYRLFYLQFGIDVLNAQLLGKNDAMELNTQIHLDIVNNCKFH